MQGVVLPVAVEDGAGGEARAVEGQSLQGGEEGHVRDVFAGFEGAGRDVGEIGEAGEEERCSSCEFALCLLV